MTPRPRLGYPSNLTDSQWARLESILPPAHPTGRHRSVSRRDVANAINYRWETGCVWRMLPHDFPYWGTVYACFRAWQKAGVIRQFREILLEAQPRTRPRRKPPARPLPWPATDAPAEREHPARNVADHRNAAPRESGFRVPAARNAAGAEAANG